MIKKIVKITAMLLVSLFVACQSDPPPRQEIICGGPSNLKCPTWMYCELGEFCGGIDKEGVCRYRPEYCPDDEDFVCGCDGETFLNLCWANAKGFSIRSKGKCATSNGATEQESNLGADSADISD